MEEARNPFPCHHRTPKSVHHTEVQFRPAKSCPGDSCSSIVLSVNPNCTAFSVNVLVLAHARATKFAAGAVGQEPQPSRGSTDEILFFPQFRIFTDDSTGNLEWDELAVVAQILVDHGVVSRRFRERGLLLSVQYEILGSTAEQLGLWKIQGWGRSARHQVLDVRVKLGFTIVLEGTKNESQGFFGGPFTKEGFCWVLDLLSDNKCSIKVCGASVLCQAW